ncbi:hypothetical protein [Arenimonas sp.]|uniref:hypothetical protein n=1 Tax=Arenimonas sp. TaxID=1872635 RepID=UPI0039E383A2
MKSWQRRALGILALGGGAVGISAFLALIMTRGNPIEWFFCSVFILLYAWGVWCGVRLLEQQPGAERSMLKYWLIQVPAFGSPYFGYAMSSGFHATVALQFNPMKLNGNFLFGSSANYSLLQADQPWFVGANLFALGIAWWLWRVVARSSPVSTNPA